MVHNNREASDCDAQGGKERCLGRIDAGCPICEGGLRLCKTCGAAESQQDVFSSCAQFKAYSKITSKAAALRERGAFEILGLIAASHAAHQEVVSMFCDCPGKEDNSFHTKSCSKRIEANIVGLGAAHHRVLFVTDVKELE